MRNLLIVLLLCCASAQVIAGDFDAVKARLEIALAADVRGTEDTNRDKDRLPVQTLEFFGLRDDMKVIELIPGAGWYTKLLAPVLRDNGEFYVAYGTSRVAENLMPLAGFDHIRLAATGSSMARPPGARHYVLDAADIGVTGADMVFTFRNYHNFDAESRAAMNQAVFDALKPGGIYAVVDHSRRHMEPDNPENRRRVDPVMAIKEIQAAGFEFVDYSDLHYRADDELRFEVGRATVTGNTDRFSFKFRKPE